MKHTLQSATALLAAALLPASTVAQQATPPAPAPESASAAQKAPAKPVSSRDRRRAAKIYLEASKQFERGAFEQSMDNYTRAAELDPDNHDYALAAEVARSHAVTALVQQAAKARNQGDPAAARAALEQARSFDPKNVQVAQHTYELADDLVAAQSRSLYGDASGELGSVPRLEPTPGTQSFHLRTDRRSILQQVYRAYGLTAVMDQSVPATIMRFDVDDATYAQASAAVADTTGTFAVPLDTHRVVVVQDTKRNRDQFQREETETVYLDGLKTEELTEISNIAKNVFGMKQVGTVEGRSALTLRAQPAVLDAFNRTMNGLVEGRSQVMLDVEILQVARTHERNTGATLPQQMTAFNVYSEEQSILSQNSDLVQEIISSGLASADDPLAILGILIASGAVSSTLFENGIATIGYGLTWTGLATGKTTLNLVLNSSSTRALDNVRLRAADGQEETLRNGMRYPILTASYSGLTSSSISGLTSAGTSSTLSSLLSSSSSSTSTIPQIQYQDLGLTLKATPKVLRNGDVALSMDLKLTSLAGSTENDIPVLNSRSYSGVITVKAGSGALLVSLVDESESRALSGTPGLSEIPGLNNLTDKDVTKDYATLVIAVTPHVLRGPDTWGHTPMLRIDRTAMAR